MKTYWTILLSLILLSFLFIAGPTTAGTLNGPSWLQKSQLPGASDSPADNGDDGSDDDGSDDGNDDGSDDDGSDDGNDDGSDDDGSDDGNDDGNDDGSDDDGSDDGSDDGHDDDGSDDGSDDDGSDDDGSDDDGSDDDGSDDDGSDDDGSNDDGSDDGNDDGSDEVTVGFDDDSFEISEDEELVSITVERSGDATGLVMVDYASVNGSATAGEDYAQVAGTLVWAAGDDDEQTFEIPIFEDGLEEGNEDFTVVLTNVVGEATLEDAEARVTILDNDGAFACVEDDDTLCLQEDRFKVEVRWETPDGTSGQAGTLPLSETSGLFRFFGEDNFEIMFKVLDGCGVNGLEGYWVFVAATTNLGLEITVTDTLTGKMKEFVNPVGTPAEPIQDLTTFDTCP